MTEIIYTKKSRALIYRLMSSFSQLSIDDIKNQKLQHQPLDYKVNLLLDICEYFIYRSKITNSTEELLSSFEITDKQQKVEVTKLIVKMNEFVKYLKEKDYFVEKFGNVLKTRILNITTFDLGVVNSILDFTETINPDKIDDFYCKEIEKIMNYCFIPIVKKIRSYDDKYRPASRYLDELNKNTEKKFSEIIYLIDSDLRNGLKHENFYKNRQNRTIYYFSKKKQKEVAITYEELLLKSKKLLILGEILRDVEFPIFKKLLLLFLSSVTTKHFPEMQNNKKEVQDRIDNLIKELTM